VSAHRVPSIRLLPHALVALSCCLMAPVARAQEKPGGSPGALTNASAIYSVPATSEPSYMKSVTDPTFGTKLIRIARDPGSSTSPVAGSWGTDTRHHYSKDQPWIFKEAGKRFSDELIAVKLDGRKAVERYAHMHSAASGCYRCEQHPAPSPDGSMIAFASNRAEDCGAGCGSASVIKNYVLMAASGAVADAADGPRPATDLALARIWPNPSTLALHVAFALPGAGPARLELIDVAGRSVLAQELGSPGAGAFEASLGHDAAIHPGTYWLRLSQAGSGLAATDCGTHIPQTAG